MTDQLCYIMAYAIEAIIALCYFENLFTPKQKISVIAFSTLIGYLLLYGVVQLQIIALNTLSFFVVNFLILFTTYNCKLRTAILHSAFLSFIMTVAEVLVTLFTSLFAKNFDAYTYDITVTATLATLGKLLYFVFSILGIKAFSPHKEMKNEPKLMFLFCFLPVFSTIVSVLIVYIGMRSEMNQSTTVMMLVNIFALLLVNILFLALYNYMQKANADYLALQLSIQKDAADAAYYQSLQEQAQAHRILIHDIKNHLHVIKSLAVENQIEEISNYISQLEQTISHGPHIHFCADPTLNLLLNRYAEECRKKEITINFDIRRECTTFMDAPSVTALYGNLLSNAMESADMSKERIIELSITKDYVQHTTLVSIENSCDRPPIQDHDGGFFTQKTNGIHGVGLKSINRIVRKYNGISKAYYNVAEQRFHCIIQFPY